MNYLKETTTGVDTVIKGLQKYLYCELEKRWRFNDFDAYGRVYSNKRSGKLIPEYYDSDKEYKEVLLDDRIQGIIFFNTSDFSQVNSSLIIQDCDIIFSIDLDSLKGSEERQDEEIRQDVLFLLDNYVKKQEVKQTITGLKNVYKDFNGVADYFLDMQNFYHFKITLELRYINVKCI